jgi:DNA-binding NarL/FixJ family response regulator
MQGSNVRSSYAGASLERGVSLYVASREGRDARVVVNALAREGFTVNASWGPLEELMRPGWAHLDVLVVVESEPEGHVDAEYVQLDRALPGVAIVVICSPEREHAHGLIWAGADAIVFDPGADAVIGPVVRAVLAGSVVVPRELRAGIQPPALTRREREMLELVVEGLTNREIADQLYLAESTVKRHLSSTFRRLGVRSRREAAAIMLAYPPPHGVAGAADEPPRAQSRAR